MNTLELRKAYNDSDIKNTCEVAIYKVVSDILGEDVGTLYHSERWDWAKKALENPRNEAEKILAVVLMENASLTYNQVANADYISFVNNINTIINGYITNRIA